MATSPSDRRALLRAELASWSSVIGALGLVAAGLIWLASGELSGWVFASVVTGVAGIALWMGLAPNEFAAWLAGRQTRYGTSSILLTILFVGAIAYAYVLTDRANLTTDFTTAQRYSLNTPTLHTIEQLQERGFRVRIVGFFTRNKLREQESADVLLRQYEAASDGAIEVEYIDPDEQPDVAQRFGYQAGYDGTLFLAVLGPDGTIDPRTTPLYLGAVNERDITTGLKTIAAAGEFKVYFTTGHGELDLENTESFGISGLRFSLVNEGIGVEPLSLLEVSDTGVPADADALFIVGPDAPFSRAEVDVIRAYMERGGRLAIFADPTRADLVGQDGTTFLAEGSPFSDYLWEEFGVRAPNELVLEFDSSFGSEFNPILRAELPNPLLSLAYNADIVARWVRVIELVDVPTTPAQNSYAREPLLATTSNSFAEADLAELVQTGQTDFERSGPLIVGVTVRRTLESQEVVQPRLVLIGDSDIVANEFAQEYAGNVWLWTDTVDWLTGFVDVISFTPVTDPTRLSLVASDQELNTIAVVTMVILPGTVLLSGVVVWWYRRR